jgi:phosphoglycerate dehydrogenase-like enzyme
MPESIASTGPLPAWARELFSPCTLLFSDQFTREAVLSRMSPQVVGILARGPVLIDAEMMRAAPNLRVIGRAGVGYDTVDVPEASRRGIPVVYTPGAMAWAVAEHTLSLMLAAAKNLPHWRRVLLEGEWKDRYRRRNLDLQGATVGIVGYGRIGRQVRRLLAPFDCRVLVNGPNLTPGEMTDDGVEAVPLLELLGRSDIVTLHPPLNRETRGLINSENIGSFKPGSILVNLGRGALVESHDLLFEALETGRLQAVALDVFLDEPPDRSHPLFRHPGAVLTPHVGSATLGAQRGVLETVAGDMMAVLEGRRPTEDNLVNPEVLDRMRQEK